LHLKCKCRLVNPRRNKAVSQNTDAFPIAVALIAH
jgi:hypothetical protein